MKKKIQEHYRIISLDGSDVYKLSHPSHMYGKLTAMKDGEIDYSKFNATLDVSLDTKKLAEFYPKHESEMGVPFVEDLEYTRAIINLSFDYAVKLFEQSGNRYIRFGYSAKDEDFRDHICIREINGVPTLIAVEIPHYSVSEYAPVENPVDASVLGKYFIYDDKAKAYRRSKTAIPTAVKAEQVRDILYRDGFDMDGIHFVRYKRSAGASRGGRCLFIAEPLYADMIDYIKSHRRGRYTTLLTEGTLNAWLHEIDLEANRMLETIISRFAAERGIQLVQSSQIPKYIEEADCKLTLYRNCRNTENIATTSLAPITERSPKLIDGCVKGAPAKLHFCIDGAAVQEKLNLLLESLKGQGVKDIVILTCKTEVTSILSSSIANGVYRNKYRFSTCRKFKGLEADAVILVDVDVDTFVDNNILLYYVGTSRARLWLDIITTMDSEACTDVLQNVFEKKGHIRSPQKELAAAINAVPTR